MPSHLLVYSYSKYLVLGWNDIVGKADLPLEWNGIVGKADLPLGWNVIGVNQTYHWDGLL